jgi:hypothetical protein
MITTVELTDALGTLRFWLVPDGDENVACRGHILHPHDAVSDIITAIKRLRSGG